MATKIPAAQSRLFKNIFICRKCNQRTRTEALRITNKQIMCRRCGGRDFRPDGRNGEGIDSKRGEGFKPGQFDDTAGWPHQLVRRRRAASTGVQGVVGGGSAL